MPMRRKTSAGMTLMEIMVVLAIMSVITVIASNTMQTQVVTRQVDALGERAMRVSEAVKYFRQETNDWPSSIAELVSGGFLREHPDANMPRYADQFTLTNIGGNWIIVRYQTGDERYARRLAGVLPNGQRFGTEVRYQVDRPGFEASLQAVLDSYYRLDGSTPLEGNMNADGHDITNVGDVQADRLVSRSDSNYSVNPSGSSRLRSAVIDQEVRAGRLRTDEIRSAGNQGGFNITNNRVTSRTDLEVAGDAYANALIGRPSSGTAGVIRPNGTSDFRGRVNVHGTFNTYGDESSSNIQNRLRGRTQIDGRLGVLGRFDTFGDTSSTSVQNQLRGRTRIDGRTDIYGYTEVHGHLRAQETMAAPYYRILGSVSEGSSCDHRGSINRTNSDELVQCRSGRWRKVSAEYQHRTTRVGGRPINRPGGSSWSALGTTPTLPAGTYKVDFVVHCHHNSGHRVAINTPKQFGVNTDRMVILQMQGSGHLSHPFSVYYSTPRTSAGSSSINVYMGQNACTGSEGLRVDMVRAHRLEEV
ncbi:prepilin-type N-terminal cleavage/methylation domain-containing protein [Marinimicrobium sp. ABcell2]|uniref:prepilin-type N-terminal cleavage/methylation domain-containing protein n=1 Tax=Marinimicrobium sp. ABcell2 TaxID=3069751 RepID=UPI00359C7CF2